ncbi:STAS domain-containing protein [Dactylosporangium aurantiacum]|uniref:STAS domain-containing protein n=1 Tax=Dactylosporangium aurantiacum TaxID=35754 RepID=A0A9Q9IJW5_9ACTN|nr:STAS domain-containing protein [Dactylosporangium aurantiacum]MDG6107458.1 STAS domain-containing protein [Dactylosporangium aurantiacum]UWZ54418.1 STAS domain-containing protein [Dactylosporangium aurantiacum]
MDLKFCVTCTADDVTAATAPDLDELIRRTLAGLDAPHTVVIDLHELEVFAVTGARTLVTIHERCRTRGIDCHLVAPPDHPAHRVLSRLDLSPDPRIVDSVSHNPPDLS